MAQIKTLKINADGFTEEHGASDDITFATVTGATQLAVTSGVTIDSNITFNAVTDTIAGIQNQNLLDKTANETLTGTYTVQTGSKLILEDAPTLGTHAANKSYVDGLVNGVSWQDPIIDQVDFTTAEPGTPSVGDRYINTVTGTSSGTSQSVTIDYIYEWNGTDWTEIVPQEGWALWDETQDAYYAYNNSLDWVKLGSVITHNNLSGLQGGNGSTEYYHMTAAEDTWLNTVSTEVAAANVLDKTAAETISGVYTFTNDVNISGGALEIPTAIDGSPAAGGIYMDTATQKVYGYDGSTYFDIGGSGTATNVVSTYTAGAGGIAQYDIVYISANNTVLKGDANAFASSKVIGFAPNAITAAASGSIQEDGVLAGVLTGATAGDAYFLSETPGLISTTRPTTSGAFVTLVGYAKNATDLHIQIQQIGRRA